MMSLLDKSVFVAVDVYIVAASSHDKNNVLILDEVINTN